MTRLESFFLLSSLVLLCQGAIKVRYTKAGDTQAGVYSFLSLLGPVQPKEVQFPDPSPFTTPPTSTTSTTTPTPQLKLVDYCLQPRGQFRYEPDCHKFVNCWDGQAFLKTCFPANLVFDPASASCLFDWAPEVAGFCQAEVDTTSTATSNESAQHLDFGLSKCSDFVSLGYKCVEEYLCRNGQIANVSDISLFDVVLDVRHHLQPQQQHQSSSKFKPWLKICPQRGDICCKDPNHKKMKKAKGRGSNNLLCPMAFTGLKAYPSDCSKFVNCWKGGAVVQNCAPGTLFNPKTGNCDFAHKVNCHPAEAAAAPVARASVRSEEAFPSPPSGQRVRLRGSHGPKGYVELFHRGQWGLVCDAGTWTYEEAHVVCRMMGFKRGAKATTQGLIHGPVNEERKITEQVECQGSESGLEKCNIIYAADSGQGGSCKLTQGIVSVSCLTDSYAACNPNEVPWGGSCFSLNFNRSSLTQAQALCQKEGKNLAEITSQEENDVLSELLLQNDMSPGLLTDVWTGGVAGGTQRSRRLYWIGSKDNLGIYQAWWPGWNGEKKGVLDGGLNMRSGSLGVKLSRKFEFLSRRKREQRLTDYYFWALEDLRTELAFLCKGPQKDIGCISGRGQSYRGQANRGESGETCLPWDSPHLQFVLDDQHVPNLGPLAGNNFCRNPDGDRAPWCLAPNGEFDYCDIPQCNEDTSEEGNMIEETVLGQSRCKKDQFQCSPDQCIITAFVCDGHSDCLNGKDESNCTFRDLDYFDKAARQRLDVKYVERWLETTTKACAALCRKAEDFKCRSFSYNAAKRMCVLNELNVGLSGKLTFDTQWDYYELRDETKVCSDRLKCANGKCLKDVELCDGKDDCGDHSDEDNCQAQPNIEMRLIGGSGGAEGTVEIKAFNYDFGGICDDGFSLTEANVICKQLGFRKGAKKGVLNSKYGSGRGQILLDELKCTGSESSILECKFDPWTKHDCSNNEWAGVVCKEENDDCNENEQWSCNDNACIPLDFLCDGQHDCTDGSDERPEMCNKAVEVRLAGGNNLTSGRVEVRHKGVWGTVCDDNFGEEEGQVICRMLGLEGKAIVHSEAAFGAGKGPIWIQNIVCQGDEASLLDCKAPSWTPTYQCKHLEDVGIECIPHKPDSVNSPRIASQGDACGLASVESPSPNAPTARIAGGLQSRPGSEPWAASIRLKGSSKSFHWCGAVVISEFHVLTVAHCMEDYPISVYRVRVGDWDLQVSDINEQELRVKAVHYHEEYNVGLYLANDIALVRIQEDGQGKGIQFGDRVGPACLPFENVVLGDHLDCHVYGWGSTGIAMPGYTRYLQTAKMPILDTMTCIAPTVYGPNKLSSSMFCAGYLDGGIDTCQGDSGGALMCNVRGRQTAVGLTSWGYGCGRPNRPGVYTKIADYLQWIKEHVSI